MQVTGDGLLKKAAWRKTLMMELGEEVLSDYSHDMKLEELSAEADKLPEDERASLAARLLHGLEKPHYSVADEEVRRRMDEAEENPGVMITFDQLVSGLRFRAS